MDDTRFFLTLITVILAFSSALGRAADVEFITLDKKVQLETLFATAGYVPNKDDSKIRRTHWRCDMFGVRSRMQVQRGLDLYRWSEKSPGPDWHNEGAQIVVDYKVGGDALIGVFQNFEDHVKITPKGQLISRLSVKSPDAALNKNIIAYSLCDPI